jgi:hypothetical protein
MTLQRHSSCSHVVACIHGRNEKHTKCYITNAKGENPLEDLGTHKRVILKTGVKVIRFQDADWIHWA